MNLAKHIDHTLLKADCTQSEIEKLCSEAVQFNMAAVCVPPFYVAAAKNILPNTDVQLCVIHQIRNSIRYVASKDQKAFMRDLKPVYKAINKDSAELALDELDRLWGSKYPAVIASWRDKWHLLSAYFKYPDAVRKPIYTTNAVEAVHRQFRKLTKTKGAFPNETSLLKLLYVGMLNASEKWTMPINNWGQTMMQLSIHFPGRLDAVMKL